MKNKFFLIFIILFLSGFAGLSLSLYFHQNLTSDNLPNTLPPDVQIIQTFHSPVSFVKQLKGDPDAGRKIFIEFCASCHAEEPIIDIKAPRIGDKQAWKAWRKVPINTLLKITTQGVGPMPARGGCFECSDDQLKQAIQYILKQS